VYPGPYYVLFVALGNDSTDPDDRVTGRFGIDAANVKIDVFVGFAKSEHVS
jgi:hypothetical protein